METEYPKVELANKDWVMKELIDTERRIEKAFHDQTRYLGNKLESQTKWIIGLMLTLVLVFLVEVFLK